MNDLIAACTKGNLDVVRKLVTEKALDPSQKDQVTGMSPFHYASQHGHVDILAFFLADCGCEATTGTRDKNTALHLACANSQVDAGTYLIEHLAPTDLRRKNKEGNTPLHLACIGGSDRLVHTLLERFPEALQAVNAKGITPFGYAVRYSHLEIAKILIARSTNGTLLSTTDFAALFPDFKRYSASVSRILDDPLKVFVVGDRQTGKSSFIRSLQAETPWEKFKGISQITPGIDRHTMGLVPNDFVSQSLGRLIFYDLASGTDCIHEDLLQSDSDVERCLFVIVIDTSDSRKGMETKILYWLNFISLQCTKSHKNIPNVVIVGSHADIYKPFTLANSNRLHIAYNNVLSSNKELKVHFNLLRKYSVDCRKANSLAFPYLRVALKKFCDRMRPSLKSGKDLPDICYILDAVLLDALEETSFPGIRISELAAKISEKATVPKVSLASFLPPMVGDLLQLCTILQDCGRVLLLRPNSASTSAETWIVQPSHHLLTKIDAALTRKVPIPDQATPSPAFVTFEFLTQCLTFVPKNLLLPLLEHFKVYDGTEVTVKNTASKSEEEELYLYIPALLPREHNLQVWNPNGDAYSLMFAWSFIPLAGQFFSPRFLKMLLLSLFKKFSESEDFSTPSVWSKGICTQSSDEIEVCVTTDRKSITLNMRCQPSHEVSCLVHRNQILTEIRTQKEHLQPVTNVEEYLVPSKVAQFPVTKVDSTKHLRSISLLKQTIAQGSRHGARIELPSSFLEPSAFLTKLSEAHQKQLVDPDNASKIVSMEFRDEVAAQLRDEWPNVTQHLFQQSFESETSTQSSQSTDSEPYQTFSELLQYLSSFSMFDTESSLTNAIQENLAKKHLAVQGSPSGSPMTTSGALPSDHSSTSSSIGHTGLRKSSPRLPQESGSLDSDSSSDTFGSIGSTVQLHPHTSITPQKHKILQSAMFKSSVEVLACDHSGGSYSSECHNIKLHIPEGAITAANLEFAVTLHGPFEFPEDVKPVSPIVWLSTQEGIQFAKSVELTIPHIANRSESLAFYTADIRKLKGKFQFQRLRAQERGITKHDGTLKTKLSTNQSRFICIACMGSTVIRKVINSAKYYIIKATPKTIVANQWKVFYCIVLSLPTCIEMVKRQLGDRCDITVLTDFHFGRSQPNIEIEFQRNHPKEQWYLTLEGGKQITAHQICFWSDQVQLEQHCLYPPRFTIVVSGERATDNSHAEILFKGIKDGAQDEIPLIVPLQSQHGLVQRMSVHSDQDVFDIDLDSISLQTNHKRQPSVLSTSPGGALQRGGSIQSIASLSTLQDTSYLRILDSHLVMMTVNLDVQNIRPHLRQAGVISAQNYTELLNYVHDPTSLQVEMLVQILRRKGREGFCRFLQVLKSTIGDNYGHADIIHAIENDPDYKRYYSSDC